MKKNNYRIESDSLGKVKVPECYMGRKLNEQ